MRGTNYIFWYPNFNYYACFSVLFKPLLPSICCLSPRSWFLLSCFIYNYHRYVLSSESRNFLSKIFSFLNSIKAWSLTDCETVCVKMEEVRRTIYNQIKIMCCCVGVQRRTDSEPKWVWSILGRNLIAFCFATNTKQKRVYVKNMHRRFMWPESCVPLIR